MFTFGGHCMKNKPQKRRELPGVLNWVAGCTIEFKKEMGEVDLLQNTTTGQWRSDLKQEQTKNMSSTNTFFVVCTFDHTFSRNKHVVQ